MDNTPLLLLVIDEPDTYAQGRKDTISVQISNPRKNDVKNVILSVSGANAEITPIENLYRQTGIRCKYHREHLGYAEPAYDTGVES